LRRFIKTRINPFSKIDTFFKARKLKEQKKELQFKIAVGSGGIKRMK
jgi:hypothetical protein